MDSGNISIHAPAKGATNTNKEGVAQLKISIHAPAKGATILQDIFHRPPGISIHAPAKGATPKSFLSLFLCLPFQSTLPRRERPNSTDTVVWSSSISIHAPAKGATFVGYGYVQGIVFQSTLPRRERLYSLLQK